MKQILHVVNIYFVIPYFLGDQLLYFKNKGYNEHIICSPSEEIRNYALLKKFSYYEVPVTRSISMYSDLKAIIATIRYIRSNNIDIVVGHTPKGALIGMISGFLTGVSKRIYFRHGLVYETSHGFKRFVLKSIDRLNALLANKIVCVSPSVYNQSLKDLLNPKNKQIVLHKGTCNGIDINRFNTSSIDSEKLNSLRNKFNLHNDYVIGYVGRLVRDKGIVELVESFLLFNKRYENTKLLLVGMLEERDALPSETVDIIRSHPNIINTGYVDNSLIENYYKLMDVFILPSYREGFPTSVLEASAMELPIITTEVTGCRDAIIPNETGVFVEHTSSSLLEAICEIYRDKAYSSFLGKNGRKFVVENFRQELVWNEIEKLYK